MPWKLGKSPVWDTTCPATLPLHMCTTKAAREAATVVLQTQLLNCTKYTALQSSHHFVPFAVETKGALGQAELGLLQELRQHQPTVEPHSRGYLQQRLPPPSRERECSSTVGDCRDQPQPKRSLLGLTAFVYFIKH